MKKEISDYVYFNSYFEENRILFNGIGFNEFFNVFGDMISNILLIKHNYSGDDYHAKTKFEFVRKRDINNILEDNIYEYGDFCWIDFKKISSLDKLTPDLVAELLYIGHTGKSLKSPFFEILENRYVYWAHDDGWHNELYLKNINDIKHLLRNIICTKTAEITGHNTDFPNNKVLNQLMEMSSKGILIDFTGEFILELGVKLPIYIIGKQNNMDNLYRDLDLYKTNSNCETSLVYQGNMWLLES